MSPWGDSCFLGCCDAGDCVAFAVDPVGDVGDVFVSDSAFGEFFGLVGVEGPAVWVVCWVSVPVQDGACFGSDFSGDLVAVDFPVFVEWDGGEERFVVESVCVVVSWCAVVVCPS